MLLNEYCYKNMVVRTDDLETYCRLEKTDRLLVVTEKERIVAKQWIQKGMILITHIAALFFGVTIIND